MMNYLPKISFLSAIGLFCLMGCTSAGHPNSLMALTEFPGFVGQAPLDDVTILQEQFVPNGVVLLYRYPHLIPNTPEDCVAVTFVSQTADGLWQSQSAARLGCDVPSEILSTFQAAYTIGGNIQELSTAYGVSPVGQAVKISWQDGQMTTVTLTNHSFVSSRPGVIPVQKIELLDEQGVVLEHKNWADEP